MVRNDGAEARKDRILKMARTIQAELYQAKAIGFIPLKRTIASLMLETGLTKEKVIEYINLLQEAGQVEVDIDKDQLKKAVV